MLPPGPLARSLLPQAAEASCGVSVCFSWKTRGTGLCVCVFIFLPLSPPSEKSSPFPAVPVRKALRSDCPASVPRSLRNPLTVPRVRQPAAPRVSRGHGGSVSETALPARWRNPCGSHHFRVANPPALPQPGPSTRGSHSHGHRCLF